MQKTDLCKTCKYYACPLVPPVMVKNAEVLVVGEAPGVEEARQKIPFVGKSGLKLRGVMKEVGFDLSKVAITNTVKCRPPENEQPPVSVRKLCAGQFLFKEISEIQPKLILCAGAVAESVFEHVPENGDFIKEWGGYKIAFILHPAAVLYNPMNEPKFRQGIRKAYNYLYPQKYDRILKVVDTLEQLDEVRKFVEYKRLLGADIETNSTLDPFSPNARITRISFGDDHAAYSISLDRDDPVFAKAAIDFIKGLLKDPTKTFIFQRSWFDVKFLKARGIDVAKFTDTRLMAYLLNENRGTYGLKELASEYIGEYEYTINEKDRERFGRYNCLYWRTKVITATGEKVSIKEIVDKQMSIDVMTRNSDNTLSSARIVGWHKHVDTQTRWLLVRTKGSRQAKHEGTICTPDHRWWTERGWVRADELTPADRIMQYNCGSDEFIHGCILGDGCITKKNILLIRHNNEQYIKEKAAHLRRPYKAYACKEGYKPGSVIYEIDVAVSREWRCRFYSKRGSRIFVPPASWKTVAIWYGDDGCLSGRFPRLDVHRYDIDAVVSWLRSFLKAHGGAGNVSVYNKSVVTVTGSDRDIFFERIAEYIPPSMCYKLPVEYRGRYNGWLEVAQPQWVQVDYVRKYKNRFVYSQKREMTQYCITVDNPTHTFFTPEGAVANCEDAWFTYKLYQILKPQMTPGLTNVLEKILLPAIPVINEMMLTGICVDKEYAKKLTNELRDERNAVYEELLRKFPMFRGINLNSTPQMRQVVFGALEEKPVKKTGKGSESLDSEVLGSFAYDGREWAKMILQLRKIDKLLSTYVEKIPTMVHPDGRIRCEINPMGTVTGRFSSDSPNLQNIARDARIYRMFVAGEGRMLFYFDFSQLELRIGASIANERKMLDAFNKGIDLHVRTACMITGKKPEEITKEERQIAKGASFALLYGQQADGFKKYLFDKFNIDIPLKEAERIREIFFTNYSDLPLWYERVRRELLNTQQVVYPTGRVRRFPEINAIGNITGEIFRAGINSPVQGSGNDVVVFTMVNLHRLVNKRKLPVKFVLTVHDSVMLEIEDQPGLVEELKELTNLVIKEIVPKEPMFRWVKCPLEVECKVGKSWGTLEKI